ncbi:hypothetical protein Cni_G18883 [Canna indica]|uniref:F-box domain-containing protein n=1 Tax=Canna indica TaxID=4628 RepID=A0AAQ3KL71_9LILI|nr:hypothetical protein Cni_G18883 [Canna indica]
MAGEDGSSRTLEETPTWAVAVVCLVLVIVSIIIEHAIHLIGKASTLTLVLEQETSIINICDITCLTSTLFSLSQWFKKRHKSALFEALEKIKSELMLMGFISLLLTVLQTSISKICVSKSIGDSWHPCKDSQEKKEEGDDSSTVGRRLLQSSNSAAVFRRVLAGGGSDKCAEQGQVPLISTDGIHQLHIFIFVLAVSHILYCISTMALGRLKMRKWKTWEKETKTAEYQFSHDPARFRFARETSFGRRHLSFWSKSPILIWIVCFLRQFITSVPKVDYLTLRNGFIAAHLAPQSSNKFNFQKYIKRSLEEDFKVVVGISPTIWFFAVLFLLTNTHGWYSYFWLPFIPVIIILLVGTKLQVIITRMAIRIMERGDVVKGVPVVQPADDLFWFNSPGLLLFLIHFILFQNAFELAFLAWSWYEFGYPSCFHDKVEDIIIRISLGILIQVLCSYVTLPLYALVTQMGSNMKTTIFNERVAAALRNWHLTARKHLKESRRSGSMTPLSTSRPATPSYGQSPVHLLQYYRSELDYSAQNSPGRYLATVDDEAFDVEGSPASPNPTHDIDFFQSLELLKMADLKLVGKRWEEMETDVLVKIFKELNMIELSPVSGVCRSWRLACSDSFIWNTLDLGLLQSNFIPTRASPYIWVDERSDRRLTKILRMAMALSFGNVTTMIFHFNLYMKDDHLNYIAERCPHLKRLVMPAWNRITKVGICHAIQRWENLESLTMPSIAHPPYIMEEISRSCKNFSQLKVMGTFDVHFASAIAMNLPKLKVLSLRCSIITKEALLFILDHMNNLEVLNVSHCLLLEALTTSGRKQVRSGIDQTILHKASRMREFLHCQSSLCIACKRMVDDEGLMRWYKYEDWFWRRDEVNSLDLGDYGRLLEKNCVNKLIAS